MPPPSFKLRNRLHEVEGEYSKSEIIKRIRAGKLTGEEEIQTPPHNRWVRLASHPEFYDVFLSRLYGGNYHAPESPEGGGENESNAGKSILDRATRQNEPNKTRAPLRDGEEPPADPGRTRQIAADRIGNATIHQSDIDELFKDDSQPRSGAGKPSTEPAEDGTGVAQVHAESPGAEPTLPYESEPTSRLEFAADSPLPEPVLPERKPRLSRIKVYSAVIILMLVLLFQMGKSDDPRPERSSKAKSPALTLGETKEDRIRTLTEEGDGLYSMDVPLAYQTALEIYREALTYDETNAIILSKVAQAAARLLPYTSSQTELLEEVKSALEKGRLIDPHSSTFYRAEALVALALNKLDDARRLMLNAAEADPTGAENYLVTGEVLYAVGDLPSAKISFDESVKAYAGSARSHSMVAKVAADQKDAIKAKAAALEALKINPLHPPSYLYLADALATHNQFKEARSLYETCGRLHKFASNEVAGTAFLKLAKLQELAGNTAASQRSFLLAYHFLGAGDGLGERVANFDTSKAYLQKLAEEVAYDKEYFQEQGEELLKQGKLNEALKFFQASRLADAKDGLALIKLGEVSERVASSYDDFRRVMSLYQRAIEIDPTLAKAYVRLGLLETEQYNLERAYKLLTQAVALAPNDSEPYVALGKHFYKRQDYSEALNQFLKAAKINPTNSEISYYAGLLRLLFKKEGARDALRFFYQAYTYDPQNYDALVEWLKLKVVNYEKNFAIKFVRNLIDAEPENAQLYWAMGEVYAANKEFRRAIIFYHKSLDYDNRSGKVRMSLARALESIGDLDKAVAEFRLASQLDRRNSDGFYRASDLLFQMKRFNEAEEVLKYLTNVTPNYPGAHRYLSRIAQVKKQKEQALTYMQREVSNNPQNAKFRLELAELFMEYEKFELAVQELTEVTNLPSLTRAPEFVYDKIRAYLLLSRCYRAQGRAESAEGAIKLALEIDSSDPELHRELGYVYYALQRDKEGVRAFEYYLTRNPAARDSETIKGLIQQMMIEE